MWAALTGVLWALINLMSDSCACVFAVVCGSFLVRVSFTLQSNNCASAPTSAACVQQHFRSAPLPVAR